MGHKTTVIQRSPCAAKICLGKVRECLVGTAFASRTSGSERLRSWRVQQQLCHQDSRPRSSGCRRSWFWTQRPGGDGVERHRGHALLHLPRGGRSIPKSPLQNSWSSLHALLLCAGPFYVDFAVWGPLGHRIAKESGLQGFCVGTRAREPVRARGLLQVQLTATGKSASRVVELVLSVCLQVLRTLRPYGLAPWYQAGVRTRQHLGFAARAVGAFRSRIPLGVEQSLWKGRKTKEGRQGTEEGDNKF